MTPNILTNLFGRIKKPAAPVQPAAPAVPTPAAPAPAAGDGIRNALDVMGLQLISSPEARIAAAGMRLQDMKNAVEDAPCAFPGYDEVILSAIQQMNILSQTCSEVQMNEHLKKLEEAISARTWTAENTPAFQPSMKTQYYTMMLVGLQGRINAVEKTIAENDRLISEIQAYPPEKKRAFEPNLMVVSTQNKTYQNQMEALFGQVAICQGALKAARDEMLHGASMPLANYDEAFGPIYDQIKEWQALHETARRARNDFFIKHKTALEEMMEAAARDRAARKEELRQKEEINRMNTMLGIPVLEEDAKKVADLQQQVAADEAPIQATHDVFSAEFTPTESAAESPAEEIAPAAL